MTGYDGSRSVHGGPPHINTLSDKGHWSSSQSQDRGAWVSGWWGVQSHLGAPGRQCGILALFRVRGVLVLPSMWC